MAIAQHKDSTHDIKIFTDKFEGTSDKTKHLADNGFQAALAFHANSKTPIKSGKHHKFTAEENAYGLDLSRHRIFIEHINR